MKRATLGILVCVLVSLLVVPAAWASPPPSPIVHIVQWGENLTFIARRYGVTIHAIVVANHLTSANRIYAGQRLVIPGRWTPAPVAGCTYIVQHGDTLSGIAYRHGVSVNSLLRVNNIVNPNRIYAGQRLTIPGAPGAPTPPSTTGRYYTVQRGDTLAKIAFRYGVSIWSIVKANNIANPHVIFPGQRFYIPKGSPPPKPPTGWIKPGCEHLQWPREGAVLSGLLQAKGTATHADFDYYKLEYRHDGLGDWRYITGAETPVTNGALGTWDTRAVSDGRYFFRLVVVDSTGNYPPPCEVAVKVYNDP